MKPLVMTNVDANGDEQLFHNDRSSWNVSRALADCAAGKHKRYLIDVEEAMKANAAIEVDEAKVERFMDAPEILQQPLIGVVEGGPLWLIDGHHRLRAMHRLGLTDCVCFIIEEADAAPYIVLYNGLRKPPFKPY